MTESLHKTTHQEQGWESKFLHRISFLLNKPENANEITDRHEIIRK